MTEPENSDNLNGSRRVLLDKIGEADRSLDNLATAARHVGEYELAKRVLGYRGKLVDAARDVTEAIESTTQET